MSGAAADPFEAGEMVEIHGLQAAAEHNGKAGTIVGFNLDKGRWNVRIKGRKKPLGLRPGNLRRMSGQSLSELLSAADTRARQKVPRRFNDGSLLRCAVQEKDEIGDEYPNQAAICRAKLAAGSDPNSCNHIGQTALHVAAIWGAMGVGRALVEAGADVNRRNNLNRGTPLMCAARRDQMEFAQMLLEHGADPMLQDEGGSVAYQLASDPALRELLGGPSGRLTEAVAAGDLTGVEQLASQYPELVVAEDGEGDTPIVVAIQQGHWDIALWFARHEMAKLFVDQPSGSEGLCPLHLAARARRRELVAALLKSGADPNRRSIRRNEYTSGKFDIVDPGTGQKRAVSAEHRTSLFECVESGDAAIGRLLIDGGCDVDGADSDGATPLYAALDEGQEGMAELLLAAGASPDIGNADIGLDNTLLAWAASRRRLEHVQLLLRHGADPNRPGKSGMYPLHMAARAAGKEVLQALLQSGADTTRTCATHQNCAGVTALQLVEKNKRAVATGCLEVLRAAAGEAS